MNRGRTRAPSRHRPAGARFALVLAMGASIAISGCQGVPFSHEAPPLTDESRALYAQTNLLKARALRAEGRLEFAASAARRGLEFEPDNPDLLRLRGSLLTELGRGEEGAALLARADAIAPRPPPPPDTPHPLAEATGRVRVVLLPPSPELLASEGSANRVPREWPRGPEATALVQRIETRLPNAEVRMIPDSTGPIAESTDAALAWLEDGGPDAAISMRVDRSFCARSVKDGDFAIAWLRVAVAIPDGSESPDPPHLVRVAIDDPRPESCKARAVAQAFERVLELRAVEAAFRVTGALDRAPWTRAQARTLFPELGARLGRQLEQGRRYLALGELTRAIEYFERAVQIDPDDGSATAFLDEARRSLATMDLLPDGAQTSDPTAPRSSDSDALGTQLSPAQRRGLEAQLEYEQRRREEMLSALAVIYEVRNAPTLGTVATMQRSDVRDPGATGAALAHHRVHPDETLEVRTLFAPDGDVLARYYFAGDSQAPVLREDDADGDGAADRWIGYEDGIIRDLWETESPGGRPTIHIVYAPGGHPIERVELDHDGDGQLDRLFVYDAGRLQHESWDTNGDGAFDRFQEFDKTGSLTMREEDVDGDAQIDVRTAYREGRIVRREILNPELLATELQ